VHEVIVAPSKLSEKPFFSYILLGKSEVSGRLPLAAVRYLRGRSEERQQPDTLTESAEHATPEL
jgi:hypothetical protein